MGTTYTVKAAQVPPTVTEEQLRASVEAILARINRVFSTYAPDSEISRLNAAPAGEWQPVSPEMITVIESAQGFSRLSGGAFDMTVGPLVDLWGFGPKFREDRIPSGAEIARVRERVDYRLVETRQAPASVRKRRAGVEIDLNAIVAGYAADQAAAELERAGIRNYLVDMGGELRLRGHNAQGERWRIAVEKPVPGQRTVQRLLHATDIAVSTSGDYRNFFEINGTRYSHELDPRTGHPVSHGLVSVTVLAPSALQADAMATTLLVLGPEQGYALAEREQLAVLFISRRGDSFEERATPAFDTLVTP